MILNGRNGGGKRDEPPRTSLHIANLHHTSQWHSSSGGKCGMVGKWRKVRGKEADRLSAKPTYHKPRRPMPAGERWGKVGKGLQLPYTTAPLPTAVPLSAGGKREKTSFTHEVRQSQVISTVTLSLTGPPVPFDVIPQLSLVLVVVTVTA